MRPAHREMTVDTQPNPGRFRELVCEWKEPSLRHKTYEPQTGVRY